MDNDHNWRNWAACIGSDPELFFGRDTSDKARAICVRCPVRAQCRAEENRMPSDYGIYAGMSSGERSGTRNRKRAKCGTRGGYQRHLRRHEDPCDPCSMANRIYKRKNETYRRSVGLKKRKSRAKSQVQEVAA